jgi:hypothetical protein
VDMGLLSTHFHRPYVLPTVVCHRRRVPSSEPDAYSSPSGEKRTQCTGPKWPLNDSTTQQGTLRCVKACTEYHGGHSEHLL